MTISESAPGRWRRRSVGTLASTAMIAAGFVALANPASAASTIFVNSASNDTSATCGASFSACKTIQAGVNRAQAGDTVEVAAGTYAELVDVDKGITVRGAGAASTIIDGAGQTPGNGGVVDIAKPGGDVTFTGFTVKNPTPSSNGDAFALTVIDDSADDTITIGQNVFPGDSSPTNTKFGYGVNSNNTAAKLVVTENEFSGTPRGILVEGNPGPAVISKNTFHDLEDTDAGDGQTYPPKAIYFLVDGNLGASSDNAITDNTFRDFGGIGVSVRAGYNLGGCADRTCDGTFSGTASGNKFSLTAPAATSVTTDNQLSAAFNVSALNAIDQVDLVLSENTGTVVAPTRSIVVADGGGKVNLTPGTAPNKIVPDPAPTLSVPVPESFVTNGDVETFTATAENGSTGALSNARYDLTITGTKGIKASQLKLEYDAEPGEDVDFQPVPLTGVASEGGAITGFFGPAAGFTFPASTTLATDFRLSFPDSATPPDTLTVKIDLDQVSPGTGNPVINTLATSTDTTTVSDAPAASVTVSSAIAGQIGNDETTAVTATVKNSGGGVLANQTVTFTVDIGYVSATASAGSTTLKTVTATTNASGVATAYVGSTVKGTQTITATSGEAPAGTATKTYYANANKIVLTPANAVVPAGTKQVFTATVTDVVGNPIAGAGVRFDIGDGQGILDASSVLTNDQGVAKVTLITSTDDAGTGTLTASTNSPAGDPTASVSYTVTAPAPPEATVKTVTIAIPAGGMIGTAQNVNVTVTKSDNTPAANTEVDVLVSGSATANGTVTTNSSGVATFAFTPSAAGTFTVKAIAGGVSKTATGTTGVRRVTTTLVLTSPTKGQLIANISTAPSRPGVNVAYYFVHGKTVSLYKTGVTTSKGTAAIAIPVKSGGTYTMVARIYGDPTSDAAYSSPKTLRAK